MRRTCYEEPCLNFCLVVYVFGSGFFQNCSLGRTKALVTWSIQGKESCGRTYRSMFLVHMLYSMLSLPHKQKHVSPILPEGSTLKEPNLKEPIKKMEYENISGLRS